MKSEGCGLFRADYVYCPQPLVGRATRLKAMEMSKSRETGIEEEIRSLIETRRREIKEKFDRHVSVQDLLTDRWETARFYGCLLYTSPSPRDATLSRMPSSA